MPSYHEKFFFVLGCARAQQVIFFFFALTSCGPPTHPGYSHAHCTCWSASVLLLLSLASQIFCGLASAFGLFCILILDGQCTVGAWRAARSWCACCLGEPRARGSVMKIYFRERHCIARFLLQTPTANFGIAWSWIFPFLQCKLGDSKVKQGTLKEKTRWKLEWTNSPGAVARPNSEWSSTIAVKATSCLL